LEEKPQKALTVHARAHESEENENRATPNPRRRVAAVVACHDVDLIYIKSIHPIYLQRYCLALEAPHHSFFPFLDARGPVPTRGHNITRNHE
jgi:hypothetical protein